MMTVKGIADDFHVSERTMQKLLKELETEGIIRRDPVYDDKGVQKANKIVYTGEKKRLTGKEPSIDKIFVDGNPMHLRDFEWVGFWRFADAPALFFDGIQGCRYEEPPIDEDEFYHGPPLDD